MSALSGKFVVAVAILASACYAAWNLGPRVWRERLRAKLARYIPALRLYSMGPAGLKTNAGGCSTCGTCGTPGPSLSQAPAARDPLTQGPPDTLRAADYSDLSISAAHRNLVTPGVTAIAVAKSSGKHG